jgi:hypothetical protein
MPKVCPQLSVTPRRVNSPYFGWTWFFESEGNTEVVATRPYTSYPINFSAVADWTSKQQCCLTVSVCVSAKLCYNIFAYRVSKLCMSFNLQSVYINLIIYIITCITRVSKSFNSPLCCHI